MNDQKADYYVELLKTMALNSLGKPSLSDHDQEILHKQAERAAVLRGKVSTQGMVNQIVEAVIKLTGLHTQGANDGFC